MHSPQETQWAFGSTLSWEAKASCCRKPRAADIAGETRKSPGHKGLSSARASALGQLGAGHRLPCTSGNQPQEVWRL